MSIDAQVRAVIINENGSGRLNLIDRPARSGGVPGIAGQRELHFESAPHEITALNGLNIWGGASSLMLGEVEIAERTGYTIVEFHDAETFRRAVKSYHERHA